MTVAAARAAGRTGPRTRDVNGGPPLTRGLRPEARAASHLAAARPALRAQHGLDKRFQLRAGPLSLSRTMGLFFPLREGARIVALNDKRKNAWDSPTREWS